MLKNWESAPVYYKRLDVSALLQEAAIDDVEMEEATSDDSQAKQDEEQTKKDEKEEEEDEELPNVRIQFIKYITSYM